MLDSGVMALSSFRVLPTNAKDHDVGLIAQSMERWGYLERVVINRTTGHILSGHGRIETLRAMKGDGAEPPEGVFDNSDESLPDADEDEWLIPVDYVALPEVEERAAAIGLNRVGEMGGWHEELLLPELRALAEMDVPFEGIGYDLDDLDRMIADEQFRATVPEPAPTIAAANLSVRFGVRVDAKNIDAENDLVDLLAAHGYEAKRLSE